MLQTYYKKIYYKYIVGEKKNKKETNKIQNVSLFRWFHFSVADILQKNKIKQNRNKYLNNSNIIELNKINKTNIKQIVKKIVFFKTKHKYIYIYSTTQNC